MEVTPEVQYWEFLPLVLDGGREVGRQPRPQGKHPGSEAAEGT